VPTTNVLILSSFEDEAHVMEAIQAGANGYLSKMLPASELVNALKTFANEGVMIPQPVMSKLIQGLRQMGSASAQASLVALTKTEIRVLALLGRGHSNKEIAKELDCSVKTVKNHLNSIFQKLEVSNRTEAVVKGIEMGLISAEESAAG
jgi:DNA-binding NarL/FixJ family response regulator